MSKINGDVHIVVGMDRIINPENIKPGIDLKELEQAMISGGLIHQKTHDPQEKLNDELSDMADRMGISFGDKKPAKPTDKIMATYNPPRNEYTDDYTSNYGGSGGNGNGNYGTGNDKYGNGNSSKSVTKSPYNSYTLETYESPKSEPSEEEEEEEEEEENSDTKSPSNDHRYTESSTVSGGAGEFQSRTEELKRREHINSVMGTENRDDGFSFENEKREDMKCQMLAEIDLLMEALVEEGMDLKRVPTVDSMSRFKDVESVLKILRHKNDHTRYCSWAEEFFLFGAYAIEELFDGKNMWFGRYKPDLTGWHNHVNVKLKRMRHDTGQLMSSFTSDYNIGPGSRIALELLPNLILYSKIRKQQHGDPGLFSEDEVNAATHRVREA